MPCDVRAARTMSSTRAAWYPRRGEDAQPGVEQPAHRPPALGSQLALRRRCTAPRRRRSRAEPGHPTCTIPPPRLPDPHGHDRGHCHARRHPTRGCTPLRRRTRVRRRARLAAVLRGPRPASPTRLAVGLARRGVSEGAVRRARPATGARVPGRVSRGREARRDHRRRERPPHRRPSGPRCSTGPTPRARPARHPVSRRTGPTRWRSRPRHRPTVLRDAARRPARLRRRCRRTPTGPSRSSSPRAPPGAPKGALYCNRQLAFITQTDVGDTWGGGTRGLHRHVVRAPRLHDQAARQPAARRDELHHDAVERARRRCELARARAHDDRRRRPDPARPDAPPARLRRATTSSSVPFIVVGGGPLTPGLADEARRAVRRATLASRYSCTEAGIGLGTAFDDPEEDAVVSVGPAARRRSSSRVLDDDDREVPVGEVGAVCLRSPAVMSGYWRDADATRAAFTADGFVRTGDLGWVDDRGRLRLVGRSKEMYVRGGYNVYPGRGRRQCCRPIPTSRRSRSCPGADPVMGEIGVARRRTARDAAAPPTLAQLRELRRRRGSRRTSSPRRSSPSTRCRSPRGRRSTAARSPSGPFGRRRRSHGG